MMNALATTVLALIAAFFTSTVWATPDSFSAGGHAPEARGEWRDSSPHRVRFVPVEKNVSLEVLDWGGSGKAVVLLAASGCTAHEFDDFAPKLANQYHVYGITRRGYGASGFAAGEFGADLLGSDVVAVIDALKLSRPVLVGHSFAGEELSTVANTRPDRVAGLIYLEAAYPVAFDNGKGMSMAEFQQIVREPQPPPPAAQDLASFKALQNYLLHTHGLRWPEAELHQEWEMTPSGVLKRRSFPGSAILMRGTRKYTDIPVPALAIFANPHSLGPWVNNNPDESVRTAVDAYSSTFEAFTQKQVEALRSAVHTARVITIPNANHFVFVTNEAEVLREIRNFIAGLH
jgi:non-heme chloroperoxidase